MDDAPIVRAQTWNIDIRCQRCGETFRPRLTALGDRLVVAGCCPACPLAVSVFADERSRTESPPKTLREAIARSRRDDA
jgi:hypothetical protein